MNVSIDTNVLIHLYNAQMEDLLFSSFDAIYVYEYILDVELKNNSIDVYRKVKVDIEKGKILIVANEELVSKGIKEIFEESYRDYKILFAGDRGEAYAVSLANIMGIEAFVSDDTKEGGPHETLLKELIDNVIPFTFYELLFLKYLKSEVNCEEFKIKFDKVSKNMTRPMNFNSKIKSVINRYHRYRASNRDLDFLDLFCDKHNVNLKIKINDLISFLKALD